MMRVFPSVPEVVNIPLGAVHRIANTGHEKLVFIEVATGVLLSEDDIIRIEDDYARVGLQNPQDRKN